MKQILLTQGYFALVDDEDFDRINQHKWYYNHGYAVRKPSQLNGKRKGQIWMHREIMPPPKNKCIDHISGDMLNNQKHNLRICTLAQNQWNSKVQKNSSTGIKNVSWYTQVQAYRVFMRVDGKLKCFGMFKDIKDAEEKANEVRKIRGEYNKI